MNAQMTDTVTAARSAEAQLVHTIHRAADALDAIAQGGLTEALERLARSARDAQIRLASGRDLAAQILADALAGFESFEESVTEQVEEEAALPAPAQESDTPASAEEEHDQAEVSEVAEEVVDCTADSPRKEVQADAASNAAVAHQDDSSTSPDPKATPPVNAAGASQEKRGKGRQRGTRRRGG